MNNFQKRKAHLKTIKTHRKFVRKMCWKMGLFWQGLTHDLSKYSKAEMSICKYWTGKGSPHQVCREITGYSPSWNHHYHKNKHHSQFWLDEDEDGKFIPIKMPFKYVIEMFCDMVGAGKAYSKGKGVEWKCSDPWDYYEAKAKGKRLMNHESEYLLIKFLWILKEKGEEKFLKWYNSMNKYIKNLYDTGNLEFVDNLAADCLNKQC